jgi:hypothetical protein
MVKEITREAEFVVDSWTNAERTAGYKRRLAALSDPTFHVSAWLTALVRTMFDIGIEEAREGGCGRG